MEENKHVDKRLNCTSDKAGFKSIMLSELIPLNFLPLLKELIISIKL